MTRPARLYALLRQSTHRSVDYREFIAMIEAFGFASIHTRGSHHCFAHPTCPKHLVLQPKGKEAKRYQIHEFLAIVDECRLTLEA